MTMPLRQTLRAQYEAHKSWSAQLHHDNLLALAETRSELRPVPSYTTVRRFLAAHGLTKRRPMTTRQTEGALAAAARLEAREVRSYESEYVNGLWHWDCHYGSRKVLTPRGEWQTPVLFGVLDVEHTEQHRRLPLAARCQHLARTVMTIPMPESVHILGFVAAHLARLEPCRRRQRAFGLARRHRATFGPVSYTHLTLPTKR